MHAQGCHSLSPQHTQKHTVCLPISLLREKKNAFKSALFSPQGLPLHAHSQHTPDILPPSSQQPFFFFPPTLVLSQSRSTAHPAHKLTPGNPSVTLTALTQRIESQHQQQWERKKRGLEKNVGKQQTRGIGGALISYFTQSNSWLSAEGNP